MLTMVLIVVRSWIKNKASLWSSCRYSVVSLRGFANLVATVAFAQVAVLATFHMTRVWLSPCWGVDLVAFLKGSEWVCLQRPAGHSVLKQLHLGTLALIWCNHLVHRYLETGVCEFLYDTRDTKVSFLCTHVLGTGESSSVLWKDPWRKWYPLWTKRGEWVL